MKKVFLVAGLVLASAPLLPAQTGCPTGIPTASTAAENSKQQAADLFQYMAPQLGVAIAGGSPTLGQSSTLGGVGHFSVGVHGTAVYGSVPQVDRFPTCSTGRYSATL